MATPRRICVFTGTRAEYGLLYWLMKEIQTRPELELQLLVSGMHLSPEFGSTWKQIEEDGFAIDAKVENILSSDTPAAIAAAMGIGTIRYADALDRLDPDILVILGDRFEGLAAAQTAMVMRIPVAHIHGGEATEGLIDEAIRHAITKMAQLHFTAAEPYRRKVIQLGEHPDRVFCFGAPGVDNFLRLPLLDRDALESALGFRFGKTNLLVTCHPVTLKTGDPGIFMGKLLAALDRFPDTHIVVTRANADTEGRILNQLTDAWAAANPGRVHAVASLGQVRYLSTMKLVDAIVGNSSSGIIEGPSARTPTVNIGDRQKGRLRAESVIDCAEDTDAIEAAIRKALSPDFQEVAKNVVSPFGDGTASGQMADVLSSVSLDGIIEKTFYELPVSG